MDKFTKDNSEMMSDTAKEYTDIQTESQENSCGKRDKQTIGYIQKNKNSIELDVRMKENSTQSFRINLNKYSD